MKTCVFIHLSLSIVRFSCGDELRDGVFQGLLFIESMANLSLLILPVVFMRKFSDCTFNFILSLASLGLFPPILTQELLAKMTVSGVPLLATQGILTAITLISV